MSLPSHRGLFVVGVARSGTTVLQNALNHSREIYLLGEPDFHLDDGQAGFAGRYNAMHRAWGNQENKSSYLPLLLEEDPSKESYLEKLGDYYLWVGSKIVINPVRATNWLERFILYHTQSFYDAHYLFIFRDPATILGSTYNLQLLSGSTPADSETVLANYSESVSLFTQMVRTFPYVCGLAHEDIAAPTLEDVGRWLKTDLTGADSYFETARIRKHDLPPLSERSRHSLAQLSRLHADLRAELSDGFHRPQLEQNDHHLDPNHYTMLGSIDRRARMIAQYLNA